MCLLYSKTKSEQLKPLLASYRFYKQYLVEGDGTIVAPFQGETVIVEGGIITSSRKSPNVTDGEIESNNISHGIHCYSDLQPEIIPANRQIVVTLLVDADDFVGCCDSGHHCVFYKVAVNKDELDAAIQKELERRKTSGEALMNDDYEDEEEEEDEDDWEDDDDDDDWDDDGDDWDDDDDDDDWDEDDEDDDEEE